MWRLSYCIGGKTRLIDVVIPTKNCALDLHRCLEALHKQERMVNVIVVDGRSTDNTLAVAENFGVKIYTEPPSKGPGSKRAVACNEGLRHCTSPYVAFLDADSEPPPTWSRDMENNMVRWESGVAGDLPSDGATPVAGITSSCTSSELTPISLIMKIGSSNHAPVITEVTPLTSIPGYNSVYYREAIMKVGGFDEGIGGCEDYELNKRLLEAGYTLLGVPESPVIHHERQTLGAFSKQMYGYGWSRGRLLRVKKIFTFVHMIPSLLLFLATFVIWWGIGYLRGILS